MPERRPARLRRLAAGAAAVAIQILIIVGFLAMDTERVRIGTPEGRSFTWLYLSPLAPEVIPQIEIVDPPEVELTPPLVIFPLPVPDPYSVRLEDLRIVSIPTLRLRPPGSPGAGTVGLGLGNYFSCNLANYSALSDEERANCAARLAALRRERDLGNPDALLFVLTQQELRQWNQWEREQREQSGPLLLPCMNASRFLSINFDTLDCVVENLTGGYDASNNPEDRYGAEPE